MFSMRRLSKWTYTYAKRNFDFLRAPCEYTYNVVDPSCLFLKNRRLLPENCIRPPCSKNSIMTLMGDAYSSLNLYSICWRHMAQNDRRGSQQKRSFSWNIFFHSKFWERYNELMNLLKHIRDAPLNQTRIQFPYRVKCSWSNCKSSRLHFLDFWYDIIGCVKEKMV